MQTAPSGALVNAGGTAALANAVVAGAGRANVGPGGYASALTVSGSGVLTNSGGVTAGDAVSSGGTEIVLAGGIEQSGLVFLSGTLLLSSGGVANAETIFAGGSEIVLSGGTGQSGSVAGGMLVVSSGGVVSAETVGLTGNERVSSGGTTIGTVISGGVLDLLSGASATGTITFAGTGGGGIVIVEDSSALPTVAITDFVGSDEIDLAFLTSSVGVSLSVSGDTVTVTSGTVASGGSSYQLTIEGASARHLSLTHDANGKVALLAVCYYPGTLILTPKGDVPVEDLRIGDLVLTADGGARPVRWIGRNTVAIRFGDPLRILPIRIKAGALADNRPKRDLLVSPEHALLVGDILVQAGALVNGLSIVREANVPETFIYYHVELPDHALIWAEGTLAESFVDNVSRMAFDNWAEHEALNGEQPIAEMPYPRAQSHRQVPAGIRAALLRRAQDAPVNGQQDVA